jgi:hypothetical protein
MSFELLLYAISQAAVEVENPRMQLRERMLQLTAQVRFALPFL